MQTYNQIRKPRLWSVQTITTEQAIPHLSTILNSLLPVFALVLIGYAMRKLHFLEDAFWTGAARLTYFVLLPMLLVGSLATASLAGASLDRLVGALCGAVLLVSLLLLLLRTSFDRWLGISGAAFTSIFQGSIRQNTYIGLGASTALFGMEGTTFAAIGLGAMVPLVNLLSVTVLSRYVNQRNVATDWAGTLFSIAKNPLILACLLGGLLNATGTALPRGIAQIITILGRAALPLGLLIVGAGLNPRSIPSLWTRISLASLFKLLLLPLVYLLIAWLLDLHGTVFAVGLILSALPTSTSSYILAKQMGGDQTLMAAILTAQTAFACITILLLLSITQMLIGA